MPFRYRLLAAAVIVALSVEEGFSDAQNPLGANVRTFRLAQGVEISVPKDWLVANEAELRAYEQTREEILGGAGMKSASAAPILFQAMRSAGEASTSAMITVLPREVTQDEIRSWPERAIKMLGEQLGAVQARVLAGMGARDISIHPARRVDAGGKTAVYFSIDFTSPDGTKFTGEKYCIYTVAETVILTFQWRVDFPDFGRTDRIEILRSLRMK